MEIDFLKIKTIYGDSMLNNIKENINDVVMNINYFKELGFDDAYDYFERITPFFIEDNKIFKNKINRIIEKVGHDYLYIIGEDISILEEEI